ncbi:MAG: hypothetical protein GOVbin564_10 [Prokaryotic dsDNA virus sp.]|nr:MAG: hypothetical protein GOVbin564_10 [Prokaryotic dsDNA virus sp.]|tara:strand:+ start:15811 stop:16731 length:921 start_codon:yes stop_codon:yes gene_type:complete
MFCCFDEHSHVLLAERVDADEKAIQDLQRQLKDQPKQLADITKAKIKELKAEKKTADQFGVVYSRSSKKLLKQLDELLKQTDPAVLLDLQKDQLVDLILQGGFAESIEDFIEQQDKLLQSINESLNVVDPTWTPLFIENEVNALKTLTVQNVFDDIVVPAVSKNVRDSLLSMVVDTPKDQAMSNLAQSLQRGAGTLTTEVRTKISQFGRSVNMIAADAVGMDLYLYTGPKDGITRNFCKPLINKVVSKDQMSKLNNNQGLSVRSSGGGYNCRHSWSPVTSNFVELANLKLATSKDISDANTGAKKR